MIIHERKKASGRVKEKERKKESEEKQEEGVTYVEKGWWSAPADAEVERLKRIEGLDLGKKRRKRKHAKEKKEKRHLEISGEEKPVSSEADRPVAAEPLSEEYSASGSVEESSSGVGGPSTTSGADETDQVQQELRMEEGSGGPHAFFLFGSEGWESMYLNNLLLYFNIVIFLIAATFFFFVSHYFLDFPLDNLEDDCFSSDTPSASEPNNDEELEPAPEIDGLEDDLNNIIRVYRFPLAVFFCFIYFLCSFYCWGFFVFFFT
jgi:hypothetical protein